MAVNSHSLDLESGSSQYATASDHSDFQFGSGDFTIMCWVKRESVSADRPLFEKHSGTEGIRWFFRTENNMRLDLTNSSTTDEILSSTNVTSTSEWNHLAVTRSGSTVTFYLNGVSDGGGSSSKSVSASGTDVYVGRASTLAAYFDGLMDEVRVYKGRALTGSEILDVYQSNTLDASLVAFWKLNNSYSDSSAGSHTLTASGSPVFSTDVPFADYLETISAGGFFYMSN